MYLCCCCCVLLLDFTCPRASWVRRGTCLVCWRWCFCRVLVWSWRACWPCRFWVTCFPFWFFWVPCLFIIVAFLAVRDRFWFWLFWCPARGTAIVFSILTFRSIVCFWDSWASSIRNHFWCNFLWFSSCTTTWSSRISWLSTLPTRGVNRVRHLWITYRWWVSIYRNVVFQWRCLRWTCWRTSYLFLRDELRYSYHHRLRIPIRLGYPCCHLRSWRRVAVRVGLMRVCFCSRRLPWWYLCLWRAWWRICIFFGWRRCRCSTIFYRSCPAVYFWCDRWAVRIWWNVGFTRNWPSHQCRLWRWGVRWWSVECSSTWGCCLFRRWSKRRDRAESDDRSLYETVIGIRR